MNRVVRGCVVVAGVVLVAVVGFVGCALYQLNSTFREQPPPDVAKVAESAPVVAADQLATPRVDADLAEVATAGTGTALGPSAVLDQCQSDQTGMWTLVWSPVTCTRTVTAYFTFNGDFERQMQSWSTALTAKGWHGGMGQALSYYEKYAGKPLSEDPNANPYLASDLPSGKMCKYSRSDGSVCLTFDWAERPRTKVTYLAAEGPNLQKAVRQRHDVDATHTESADFANARYVAIITIADDYYKPS